MADAISENPKQIPLKDLYSLQEDQVFIIQSNIKPSRGKTLDELGSKFLDSQAGKNLDQQLKQETLQKTGKWEDIKVVDELNTITGEPTGNYGFIATRKSESPVEK